MNNDQLDVFEKVIAEYQALTKEGKSRERSIFSVGAKSYFENPTSDLLAFFMDPNEIHGFGTAVLQRIAGLLGVRDNLLDWIPAKEVSVEREVTTDQYNRIDILATTPKFALVIEAKVNAPLTNDLQDYKTFVEHHYGNSVENRFCVLSPKDLPETRHQDWKHVSFKDLQLLLEGVTRDVVDNFRPRTTKHVTTGENSVSSKRVFPNEVGAQEDTVFSDGLISG